MEKKRVFGTGGELLVHQLVAQGVSYAFTNTGSAEAGFFNALLTVPGVQPILLLAESLVLSAADGYAKAARKPAFVNVHLAARTRQGSGQLQNAYFDGTPMVVTAAMRDVGSYGDHGALVASGGFSQMGTVEDITKRRWEVWDAGGIPTVTRRAFKDALTFPTGPVYVAYASSALEATNVEGLIQAAEAPHMGMTPDAGVIHAIWDALLNAEKPLLVCGPDIGAAGAEDEILTLAERLGLPVATGIFDYGSFPVHHPNYAGAVETLSEDGYDVVCCVGYRQNTRGNATDRPIHPNYLAHLAGEVLPGNTMIVSESFRNADHLMPFGFDKSQWRLVRSFGASLGYGIGAAVGAQLGAPDRPVVCSLGDGAVMYSASGFWTMARYGLPILTIVWNNLNYQTVRTNFHTFGGEMAKQKRYPEVYLGEPEIDFVMLAKAQGIQGSEVREPRDLEAALRRGVDAITAGEPYVLDVRVATVGTGAESTWHQRFKLRK